VTGLYNILQHPLSRWTTRPSVGYWRTLSRGRQPVLLSRDWEVKLHFLMSSERSLNEAFNQVPKLEALKAADRPPIRLREIRDWDPMGTWSPVGWATHVLEMWGCRPSQRREC
jgi:hypothetical protein